MAEPRISFVIGGVQKGGTTAFAQYLATQPDIALPDRLPCGATAPAGFEQAWTKEAHVFDAPGFDDGWDTRAVDERFAAHFNDFRSSRLYGDATPVYLFHPKTVERIARYNPAMRWIVLLRDPVERAISHYAMERRRGAETRPLLFALLAERRRMVGSWDDFGPDAAWRVHSYAARSRYTAQLDRLHRLFPPGQILLLSTVQVAAAPAAAVASVRAFLGLPPRETAVQSSRIFEGGYAAPGRLAPGRLLLQWTLRHERRALHARFGRIAAG